MYAKHMMETLSHGQEQWDEYFMSIARAVGTNSKCLSRKIGAVLVRDKSIVSTGYNGPPAGVPPCDVRNPNREMKCPRQVQGYKSGEGLHLCIAGHAERNALILAAKNGIETKNTVLYCDCGIPCKDCLIEIINAGVKEIVWNSKGSQTGRFGAYYDEQSEFILEHATIKVRNINYE